MLAVKCAVCAIAQSEHLRDPDGDQQRLVDDLPVGEAQRGVAGGLAARVEGAIVLERAAVAVGVPAVGLDDDAVRGPDEVGLVALDRVVAARGGELRGLERGQQRALERAAGGLGVVVRVARDQPPDERLGAGAVGVGAVCSCAIVWSGVVTRRPSFTAVLQRRRAMDRAGRVAAVGRGR